MSDNLGEGFNSEEKEFITIQFDDIDEFVDKLSFHIGTASL